MFKAYGLYKKARNASWQTLIDNKISSLPVSVVQICNNNSITILKDSNVKELKGDEKGISIYSDDKWYITYDDSSELSDRKYFTVAHELGHIFLGHPLIVGYHARTVDKNNSREEKDADSFAMRLLAPACVLWGLNMHTAADIASMCMMCPEHSEKRAKRMKELYKRNKFLTSELEQKVFEQFKEYIEKSRL